MKSPREGLPRVRVVPRSVGSDAEDAIHLARSYGLSPFRWQEDVLDSWMGRRGDGRWAAASAGLAVPRQNGKNAVIEVREFYGAAILGERIIHTAHQVKTAREAFIRVTGFFEDERHPEIAALVKEIRRANGQEAVTLHNGGQIRFIARSGPSGRGMTADVLILDEAQDLNDDELAALLPMISASPLGNPQVILTGTPPDPDKPGHGLVFSRIRADGEAGRDARLAWTDFGVKDGPLPDIDDVELVVSCNPSMAEGLISPDEAKRERGLMSPEKFARERMGWWGDPADSGDGVMSALTWSSLADLDSAPADRVEFALDVAPMLTSAAIAVAGQRPDGLWHVQVTHNGDTLDHRPGTDWLIPRLLNMQASRDGFRVWVAGGSAAESLVPSIREAGIPVEVMKATDVAAGCGLYLKLATDDPSQLRHTVQPSLTTATLSAARKDVGDSAFVWTRRKSTVDITPLYAATIALRATQEPRFRPDELVY